MRTFRIQRILRHRLTTDGAGVTTLVGLYGCPLDCRYCINQEILKKPEWKEYTGEMLLQEVLQDYCYYVATGGGVTFGGGESLLYAEAIRAFGENLPDGVHITVETSLNIDTRGLEEVLPVVSRYIIDIKTMNPAVYQAYTGKDNTLVLKNLQYLADRNLQNKCKIRIPYIPGFTEEADIHQSEEQIRRMGYTIIDRFPYRTPSNK